MYTDNTVTTLKESALIDYPFHAVLLNFTLSQRPYLIDNCFNLILFLPAGTGDFNEVGNDEGEGN